MTGESPKSVPVKFSEVLLALEFTSASAGFDNQAYICMTTGHIHFVSDDIGPQEGEEELPEDFDESEDYLSVPHKRDLDLGSRLVFAFAEQQMPDEYDRIQDIFRKKGAYARLKDFLDREGMLQRWYDFETKATEEAMRAWCEENGVVLQED
jgi:hypothetical protein